MEMEVKKGKKKEKEKAHYVDSFGTESLIGIEDKPEKGGIFEKLEWLTTKEAAIYLRKFSPVGEPSENAVHKLVSKGSIRRRKFGGRLFFRKRELDFLIEGG